MECLSRKLKTKIRFLHLNLTSHSHVVASNSQFCLHWLWWYILYACFYIHFEVDLVYHSASWLITDDSFFTRPCILFDRGIVLLSNRAQHFMIFIYSSVLHRTVPLLHSELGKTRFKYFGSYNKPQKNNYSCMCFFFLNLWSFLICCFILYL